MCIVYIDDIYEYDESPQNELGKGAFGVVYKGTQIKSQKEIAIKKISLTRSDPDNQILVNSTVQEAITLVKLNHENIVKLVAVKFDEKLKTLYIISDYCKGVQLDHFIIEEYKKNGRGLSEDIINRIIQQICEVFQYMHTMNHSHRDLKPQNIMIHDLKIKILDFGFAKETKQDVLQTQVGTELFMHPILFSEKKYKGTEVDMWALGVTIFYLTFYTPNHPELSYPFTKHNDKRLEIKFPQNREVSEDLKQLISSMLSVTNQISWDELNQKYKLDSEKITYNSNDSEIKSLQMTIQTNIRATIYKTKLNNEDILAKIEKYTKLSMFFKSVIEQLISLQTVYETPNLIYVFQHIIIEQFNQLMSVLNTIQDFQNNDQKVLKNHEWIRFTKFLEFNSFKNQMDEQLKFYEQKIKNYKLFTRPQLSIQNVFLEFKPILYNIQVEQGIQGYEAQLVDFLHSCILIARSQKENKEWDINFLRQQKKQNNFYQILAIVLKFYEINKFT